MYIIYEGSLGKANRGKDTARSYPVQFSIKYDHLSRSIYDSLFVKLFDHKHFCIMPLEAVKQYIDNKLEIVPDIFLCFFLMEEGGREGMILRLPLTLKYGYATKNNSSSGLTRSSILTFETKPKSSKKEGFVR